MVLSPADKLEILELVARYNFAIDFGNFDEWVDTFTEDGQFAGPLGTARGRAQLRQFVQGVYDQWPDARHWVGNVILEGDGQTATLTCYLDMLRVEGGARSALTGIYNDRLVKVNGAWKFSHRKVTADAPPEAVRPEARERQSFVSALEGSLDGIVACLEGLKGPELNWRPPVAASNSLYVIATHALGNAEQNVVEILGGEAVNRVRAEEFAAHGESAEPLRQRWQMLRARMREVIERLPAEEWERERDHYAGRPLTGREILLLVHRHATEHLGEAQLVRDLVLARRS